MLKSHEKHIKIMYVLECRTVSALRRGLFLCLFPKLMSNERNKHKNNAWVSAETVCHESTYIIFFLTCHNKSINDNKNHDLYTSSPCLTRLVFIVRRAGLLWSQQDFEWRWSVPLFKCLTVLEFSFILFDLCLLITFFNFIMNYVPIVTFWIFTYHKIWILSIMFCSIWSYWIIYFLACLEVSWRVVS